jgi:hypothetical protein
VPQQAQAEAGRNTCTLVGVRHLGVDTLGMVGSCSHRTPITDWPNETADKVPDCGGFNWEVTLLLLYAYAILSQSKMSAFFGLVSGNL